MDYLRVLMNHYQVKDLLNVDPKAFRRQIDAFLNMEDAEMEGFQDQTTRTVHQILWAKRPRFRGPFVKGLLGDRHISIIAALIDWFPVLPKSLEG